MGTEYLAVRRVGNGVLQIEALVSLEPGCVNVHLPGGLVHQLATGRAALRLREVLEARAAEDGDLRTLATRYALRLQTAERERDEARETVRLLREGRAA